MFRQKFIYGDSPVGRGVVQDPVAGAPLLRALQDCFVELLIYCLSCGDELMMNQPVNVEECNQHDPELDFTCCAFFS